MESNEDRLRSLKFAALTPDGEPIEMTPRIDAFARRWARRWLRLYGSLPRNDHPFPNYWNTSFIIDYSPE